MMQKVYGDECWSRPTIYEWFNSFRPELFLAAKTIFSRTIMNTYASNMTSDFFQNFPTPYKKKFLHGCQLYWVY